MKEENAVTTEQIAEWKKQFGHIYRTMVNGEGYVWHTLRRNEYVDIMKMQFDDNVDSAERMMTRQEEIVRTVILWPEDIDRELTERGALATSLADEIMTKSGFDLSESEEL